MKQEPDRLERRITTLVRLILFLAAMAGILGTWVLVYYAFLSWHF